MKKEIGVELSIVDGALNPDELTRCTGINATRAWHIGDIRPGTKIREKENGWELRSMAPSDSPLQVHLLDIFSRIDPVQEQVKLFTQRFYSVLSCSIYFDESAPEIHFEESWIRKLAEMNVRLDIDIYFDSD